MSDSTYLRLNVAAADAAQRHRICAVLNEFELRTDPWGDQAPAVEDLPGAFAAYGMDREQVHQLSSALRAIPGTYFSLRTEDEPGEPGLGIWHSHLGTYEASCDRAGEPLLTSADAASIANEAHPAARAALLDRLTGAGIREALDMEPGPDTADARAHQR